jgi:tRNA nucleotidyltransferase (CCA-adding enzyme)
MVVPAVRAALEARLPPDRLLRLRQVQSLAAELGLPVYLVGGFVRDLLLGRAPGDFDFVVASNQHSADPQAGPRLARALARAHGGEVTVHGAFGTATWFDPHGRPIDVATARTEAYPQPGALPQVTPAESIHADLGRRDFTINALAVRVDGDHLGELTDDYHGRADLEARVVRVLHPRSFVDDPTRIFRASRYAQRLGFDLAGDTQVLIPDALVVIGALSGERVRHELDLIFREGGAASILARLDSQGVLRAVHPALQWGVAETRRAAVLSELPAERWQLGLTAARDHGRVYLALLLDGDAPGDLGRALARLDVTRDVQTDVTAALALKVGAWPPDVQPSEVVRQLDRLSEPAVVAAYVLREEARSILDRYLAEWRFVRPELTGDDLLALHLPPGPQYKRILWELRAGRLDGTLTDRAGELALVQALKEAG